VSDAEIERLCWSFVAGLLTALLLAAAVSEPTPDQMDEFRERLCSGYPSE